jgi:hypothetical protein
MNILPNNVPAFSDIWQLTTKTKRKELFAKKWRTFSDERKIYIGEKLKEMKVKPSPETIIK